MFLPLFTPSSLHFLYLYCHLFQHIYEYIQNKFLLHCLLPCLPDYFIFYNRTSILFLKFLFLFMKFIISSITYTLNLVSFLVIASFAAWLIDLLQIFYLSSVLCRCFYASIILLISLWNFFCFSNWLMCLHPMFASYISSPSSFSLVEISFLLNCGYY